MNACTGEQHRLLPEEGQSIPHDKLYGTGYGEITKSVILWSYSGQNEACLVDTATVIRLLQRR